MQTTYVEHVFVINATTADLSRNQANPVSLKCLIKLNLGRNARGSWSADPSWIWWRMILSMIRHWVAMRIRSVRSAIKRDVSSSRPTEMVMMPWRWFLCVFTASISGLVSCRVCSHRPLCFRFCMHSIHTNLPIPHHYLVWSIHDCGWSGCSSAIGTRTRWFRRILGVAPCFREATESRATTLSALSLCRYSVQKSKVSAGYCPSLIWTLMTSFPTSAFSSYAKVFQISPKPMKWRGIQGCISANLYFFPARTKKIISWSESASRLFLRSFGVIASWRELT